MIDREYTWKEVFNAKKKEILIIIINLVFIVAIFSFSFLILAKFIIPLIYFIILLILKLFLLYQELDKNYQLFALFIYLIITYEILTNLINIFIKLIVWIKNLCGEIGKLINPNSTKSKQGGKTK